MNIKCLKKKLNDYNFAKKKSDSLQNLLFTNKNGK